MNIHTEIKILHSVIKIYQSRQNIRFAITLNSAITTEKNVINPVANISGLENAAGLLKTKVW
jgi:hypothetical protein